MESIPQPDDKKKRIKRILASLVLIGGAALIIWLFPNVLSGKNDPSTYVLTARPSQTSQELAQETTQETTQETASSEALSPQTMGQANSVMFQRLQQLGYQDFSLEQTGDDQISLEISPLGRFTSDEEAVEHAVDLLCKTGLVELVPADGSANVTNRQVKDAVLCPVQQGEPVQIRIQLDLMAGQAWKDASSSSAVAVSIDGQPAFPGESVSLRLDPEGETTPGSILLTVEGQPSQGETSTEDLAKELMVFLKSGPLPFPFER